MSDVLLSPLGLGEGAIPHWRAGISQLQLFVFDHNARDHSKKISRIAPFAKLTENPCVNCRNTSGEMGQTRARNRLPSYKKTTC
jgi:hypothetical protein